MYALTGAADECKGGIEAIGPHPSRRGIASQRQNAYDTEHSRAPGAGRMYADNEILFPHYVIPALRGERGGKWAQLIDRVARLDETSLEVIALMSLMIELNGCMSCETDSFRAMRGCGACAKQTLRRYKGSDDDLIARYEAALAEWRELEKTDTL